MLLAYNGNEFPHWCISRSINWSSLVTVLVQAQPQCWPSSCAVPFPPCSATHSLHQGDSWGKANWTVALWQVQTAHSGQTWTDSCGQFLCTVKKDIYLGYMLKMSFPFLFIGTQHKIKMFMFESFNFKLWYVLHRGQYICPVIKCIFYRSNLKHVMFIYFLHCQILTTASIVTGFFDCYVQ